MLLVATCGNGWGAQTKGKARVATEKMSGEAGVTKKGRDYALARWCSLQGENSDGSIQYNPPDGPVFPMPLDTAIYRDLSSEIEIRRRYISVSAAGVDILQEEVASLK